VVTAAVCCSAKPGLTFEQLDEWQFGNILSDLFRPGYNLWIRFFQEALTAKQMNINISIRPHWHNSCLGEGGTIWLWRGRGDVRVICYRLEFFNPFMQYDYFFSRHVRVCMIIFLPVQHACFSALWPSVRVCVH